MSQADEEPDNVTMLQGFEWYVPADQKHWQRLSSALPGLKRIGIDNIWLPPGCKAGSGKSNGYDLYDLYDLGEFEQKGSRATKWGTREELSHLMEMAQANGVGIYWDTVLNHKAAADYTETIQAVQVDPTDRRKDLDQPHEVTVWTGFDYPGRAGKHSGFKYNWRHFNGIDYEARTRTRGIWRFVGENKIGWATDVSDELGNYDYLMLADVDYSQPDVREDVFHWGQWIAKELGPGLRGLRFDAIKHYSQRFLRGFVDHLDKTVGEEWFLVGEYWSSDLKVLGPLIDVFKRRMSLFDVQLVYNFSASSKTKRCDLRKVFDRTLASSRYSDNAVTFVQNHDTQETQALEAVVEEWFMPLAYAMILLRKAFGYPCVFYGDLYGIQGPRPRRPAMGGKLARLILARKLYAYGVQRDYDDKADCIGWTREGSGKRKSSKWSGIAVVVNSGWTWNEKRMAVGKQHAGEVWTDILAWAWGEVLIDSSHGEGLFPVGHRGVSVWVNKTGPGRRKIDELSFDDDIYGVEKEKARVEALLKSLENSPAVARKLGSKV